MEFLTGLFSPSAWATVWTYRGTFLLGLRNTLVTAIFGLLLALVLGIIFGLMATSGKKPLAYPGSETMTLCLKDWSSASTVMFFREKMPLSFSSTVILLCLGEIRMINSLSSIIMRPPFVHQRE